MLFGIENSLKAHKGQFAALRRSRHHQCAHRGRAGAARQGRRRSAAAQRNTARPGTTSARRSTAIAACATATSSPRADGLPLAPVRFRQDRWCATPPRRPSPTRRGSANTPTPISRSSGRPLSRAPIYPELEKLTLVLADQAARGARRRRPLREAGARPEVAARARGATWSTARKLARSRAAQGAVGRRRGGHRRLEGSDHRVRRDASIRERARCASATRTTCEAELSRMTEQIANARSRSTAPRVSRRHLHAAHLLRRGEGLSSEDGHDVAPITDHRVAPSRAPPASRPFDLPTSWLAARDTLNLAHAVQLRAPPTTSSAATPARR